MQSNLVRRSFMLFVTCVAIGIGLPGATANATDVSGSQSGRWTLAGSPYIVIGDAIIPKGQTLTIEAGVVVKFLGNYGLRVEGTLAAIGRPGDRIVFTSVNDGEFDTSARPPRLSPSSKDWKGLEFAGADAQASRLEHCILRYSDKAIIAKFSKPGLKRIIITDCGAQTFVVDGKTIPVQDGIEADYSDTAESSALAQSSVSNGSSAAAPAPADELSFRELNVSSADRTVDRVENTSEALSANVVAALMIKLLAFEKNLSGAGDLSIYVLGAPHIAEELRKTIGKNVGGAIVRAVLEGQELPKTKPGVLYLGSAAKAEEARRYCRSNRILSVTGIEQLAYDGVTLGLGLGNDGRPKVLLNLSASAAEGLYWNADIMKIAKTLK